MLKQFILSFGFGLTGFEFIFQVLMPSTGRAIIPVNPSLSDRLCSLDIQFLMDGRDTKAKAHAEVKVFSVLYNICHGKGKTGSGF